MILEMLDFQGYLHFQEIAMISRWPCICWDIFPTTVVKYHVNSCYISDISTKLELQAPGADRKKTQFFPLFFGCPKIGDSFRIPLAAECMEITTGRSSILRWKGLNRCEKSDPCLLNELFGLPQISGSRVLFAGVLKRIFSGEFFNLLLVFFPVVLRYFLPAQDRKTLEEDEPWMKNCQNNWVFGVHTKSRAYLCHIGNFGGLWGRQVQLYGWIS